MAQPKKLTHKQKQEKKLMQRLESYKTELKNLKIAIKTKLSDSELDTWRWAALQIFKDLGEFEKHPEVDRYREIALNLAREASNTFRL